MHRHSYRGRKLHRDKAQRSALLRGLSIALIENGRIETTHPKAKEVLPFLEKIISKAKVGTLHSRRQVISKLNSVVAAERLIEEIVPLLGGRNSGHLRVVRTKMRLGDNAQLAIVEFVDDLSPKDTKAPKKTAKKTATAGAK